MSDADKESTSRLISARNVAGAAVLTIVLGAFGSGLWELVFRPSLGRLGRFSLDLMTFGSERAINWAYASAALNPTPIAALVLVVLVSAIPFWGLGVYMGYKTRRALKRHLDTNPPRRTLLRIATVVEWSLVAALTLTAFIAFVGVRVLNQSVLVWRVFNTDLALIAPYLSEEQEETLRAAFAAVQTKPDYERLATQLQGLASKHHVTLVDQELW
jgi:hypothetical protein